MATADTPFFPNKKSQDGIAQYVKHISNYDNSIWDLREQMRQIDIQYMREADKTRDHQRAKVANKYGDTNRFQNITIPVVMPQVEAATTYQASVFLTGSPIFGVAAPPQFIDAALMLESVIEEQQIRAGWTRELLMFFRDGFKYNRSAIEVSWEQWNTAALQTDLQGSGAQAKVTNKVWAGNVLRRRDPYNTFFDKSVAPSRVYCDGEYAGYTEVMSRIKLKRFLANLKYRINVTEAFESPQVLSNVFDTESSYYYVPQVKPGVIAGLEDRANSGTNWLAWAELSGSKKEIDYKDLYLVTTVYAQILPSDFNLNIPERNTPQVFKIIMVNNSVPVYIERQTNAHGFLPILFGVPNEDGLDFQTNSVADNAVPFQQVSSAMMNSVIAARRRAISDRVLYDPSRISEHVINSDNPSAKMPVRPAAYGKPVGESVYPFPFRDDQSGILLQEIQTVLALGNEANGQNKARQGQFVKGNKTQSEFQTVMANANGRDQMTSILYESQVFTPMKEIIKINILQYQGAEKIFSQSKQEAVQIDPVSMRDAIMQFKISDGLTPTDKLMDADSFTVALQSLGSSQQLASGYNIAPLFSYLMKQRGADLKPFEKSAEQIAYEQAVVAWQQAVAAFAKGLESGTVTQEQLPPQPTPEQFGYKPQGVGTSAPAPQVKTTQNVNNITNNITNNR